MVLVDSFWYKWASQVEELVLGHAMAYQKSCMTLFLKLSVTFGVCAIQMGESGQILRGCRLIVLLKSMRHRVAKNVRYQITHSGTNGRRRNNMTFRTYATLTHCRVVVQW